MAEKKRLGFLHTSATLVPIFEQLCREKLPEVAVFNLVDDSLIKDVIAHNAVRPQTARRVVDHVAAAEDAGADFIMVTCSSIGRAVETAAELVTTPVLRVDRPMADAAVAHRTDRRDCDAADDAGADGGPHSSSGSCGGARDRTNGAAMCGSL